MRTVAVVATCILMSTTITAGCMTGSDGGLPIPTVPVAVSAAFDADGAMLQFVIENMGGSRTFLEPLFFSSEHWRGFAGGGKWSRNGIRVSVPDYLVLIGEDGVVVPWTQPIWNGTYYPGQIVANEFVPGRFIDAGKSTTVNITLNGFQIHKVQRYWFEYQVYGHAGMTESIELGPRGANGPNHLGEASPNQSPFVGISSLQIAKGSVDPLLQIELVNLASDDARIQTRLLCGDSGLESDEGRALSWTRLYSHDPEDPTQVQKKPCNLHRVSALNATLDNGQVATLTVSREVWTDYAGATSFHVDLQIDWCQGRDCQRQTWLILCVVKDGSIDERPVPSSTSRWGATDDPVGGVEPDHYMMGVPLKPWSCDVRWG